MADSNPGPLDQLWEAAQQEGPYSGWRLTESPQKQNVDQKAAWEAISTHNSTVGHALSAIMGEQFGDAREALLAVRKAVNESLKALGHND